MSNQKKVFISLADKRPDIALDWDYEKNDITPEEISYGCRKKVYWKCHRCGWQWKTTVNSRTSNFRTTGCLKCSNKKKQETRMATLAKKAKLPKTLNNEWAKYLKRLPYNILKCPECGYEWQVDPEQIAPYTEIPCPNCTGAKHEPKEVK